MMFGIRHAFTGDYIWGAAQMTENNDGLMPLRPAPEVVAKAA
jgi:hypothetical protein